MPTLLESARKLVTRGSDLGTRIEALEVATRAARGRLDDGLVTEAEEFSERAAARLRLSADHTVVAIAGATGSGKSSTFNALTGLELSAVGVRRPTTSWATACVWGSEGAAELLDWLGHPTAPPDDPGLDAGHPPRPRQGPGQGPSWRGSSSSTCPTTTPPRSRTTSRSTGSWRSPTS